MSRPIPAGDDVEHFDPELPHHRAWLQAVLEQPPALRDQLQQSAVGALVRPLDSATDQARHVCFSSSGAMLLAFLKSGVLSDSNGEDQVLARVRHLVVADDEQRTRGDTSNAAAPDQGSGHLWHQGPFTGKASFATLDEQIAAGLPVPCAYLHRGPVPVPQVGPLADRRRHHGDARDRA